MSGADELVELARPPEETTCADCGARLFVYAAFFAQGRYLCNHCFSTRKSAGGVTEIGMSPPRRRDRGASSVELAEARAEIVKLKAQFESVIRRLMGSIDFRYETCGILRDYGALVYGQAHIDELHRAGKL